MRLLHFDDGKRLTLTDFSGRTVPPYAILSHRWGENEVLFEDVTNNSYKSKTGYRKIEFCAKQAAQDQLQYFWIDTCCIDKWNHQERSKSINSMFRWYQDAVKCYVFLPDISATTVGIAQQQSTWEARFRTSEWFSRGWTLQELIAPASVEFFSSEGQRLGDKYHLKELIHEITSIPIEALHGCPLQNFSVSDRMAWAETRKVTEPEDSAYCQLGILNINMPLSYGEGKEKALSRLREEIEAIKATPSIIPFSQNDRFVGRQSELAEVEAKLFTGKQTTKIAITGEGGTGKSQLALELAHRTKQKNKSCSVFWIDASDTESLHQAYLGIAQRLDVPCWDDEKTDIKQLVKLYLGRKSARQWLLIFDNVDDVNLGSAGSSAPGSANLIDYLPQFELGSIIFTTTDSDTAKTLAPHEIIELQTMTSDTAQRMLENHLTTPVPTSEQQEMKLLLKELSYLPLAIVQAAAYINNKNITLIDYRLQLMKQKEEAFELNGELSKVKLQNCGTKSTVTTTLLISLDQIRRNHSLATDYLFLMACVNRKDIPLDLLEATLSREKDDAVRILNAYALATRRPAESALDLHRLVHLTIRKWLQKRDWLGQWSQKAIILLLKIFPDHSYGSRSKWRRLLPHAKYALSYDLVKQEDEARTNLAWKCAMTLYADGRYNESEELFVRVMEMRVRVLGEEHPDTLSSMANLASTYRNQGRWKEAEELEVRVIETSLRVLGEEHLDTLTSMANLALTYRNQGRLKEAEELEMRVMETFKRALSEEHPDTLTNMGNLASTYRNQGRLKEAEELEVRVMETRKRVLGEEHPDTLTSMANLASTFWDQGRLKETEELDVRVMETRKRVLGEEHPSTLSSLGNLASTYKNQGRLKEAEVLEVHVMETRMRVLGEEHPDTLSSMANLASTYTNQGLWKEAEELFVRVVETRIRVLGEEHPSTLTGMNNLAYTWKGQDRDEEAISLMSKCVQLRTQILGADHACTLSSLTALDDWKLEKLDIS